MKNTDIKTEIKKAGLKQWQVAEHLGTQDSNFSRTLRHELPTDKKQEIRQAIQALKAGESNV